MMKQIICLLFLCAFQMSVAQNASAETPPTGNDNLIYAMSGIQEKPEFPGGIGEFYKYIGDHYKLPNVKNLVGKVYVTFVIEKDGSVTDVHVLRDVGYGTGEEAKRVLENSPKWIPGKQQGRLVRVQFTLPLSISTK